MIHSRPVLATALMAAILVGCGGGSGRSLPAAGGGLEAEKISDISGPGACGVKNAYRVTQAGGVRLTQAATVNLKTAQRLDAWVTQHAVPIIGRQGGGLVALKVAAHYACRTRNHQRGAKLSEHAKGNAIDISAFILADGSEINVLGWRGEDREVLRALHASACGPFGTVLGPDADRFHQDHFHFDIKDNGPFCR